MKDNSGGKMSGESVFSQNVTCPWCYTTTKVALGPQHVHDDIHIHCQKCSRFSRHKVALHPAEEGSKDGLLKWWDQYSKKEREYKDVWKKIPPDAYIACHQGTRNTPWVYTVYLGGNDLPEEYFSPDPVAHILINTFNLSKRQAGGVISSAVLSPGKRIYLQSHVRVVMAAMENYTRKQSSTKTTPPQDTETLQTGSLVQVNGKTGIFLRYSTNPNDSIRRAVVAFPVGKDEEFGDVEVPIGELHVVDVGDEEVIKDFYEQDDIEMIEDAIHDLDRIQDRIEDVQETLDDLLLEEEAELSNTEHVQEDSPKDRLSARLQKRSDTSSELRQIIDDPNVDSESRQIAQQKFLRLMQKSTASLTEEETKRRLQTLNKIIHDVNIDPVSLQIAQRLYLKLKKSLHNKPVVSQNWVPKRSGDRDVQRRVHTHFAHSGNLEKAIAAHANDLSIEDVVTIVRHYVNTGKVEKHVGNKIIREFRKQPRLLSAKDTVASERFEEWLRKKKMKELGLKPELSKSPREIGCTCENAYDPYCPVHGAQEHRPRYKARKVKIGTGVFTPAVYRGTDVLVIAFGNDGKATIQFGDGTLAAVDSRELEPPRRKNP